MFTGIIEEVGLIRHITRGHDSAVLTISAKNVLEGTKIGDSIAVDGICLTVTSMGKDFFTADVMHETLNRSALSRLGTACPVNLERAMPATGRFGGHIVAGHVDGVGSIGRIRRDATAVWFTILAGPEILRYVVEKGSITIDGITSVAVNGKDLGFDGYLDIGLYDTMEDLLVNFIGALTFSIFGYFYIKRRGKGRIAKAFIPTITTEDKELDAPHEQLQAQDRPEAPEARDG